MSEPTKDITSSAANSIQQADDHQSMIITASSKAQTEKEELQHVQPCGLTETNKNDLDCTEARAAQLPSPPKDTDREEEVRDDQSEGKSGYGHAEEGDTDTIVGSWARNQGHSDSILDSDKSTNSSEGQVVVESEETPVDCKDMWLTFTTSNEDLSGDLEDEQSPLKVPNQNSEGQFNCTQLLYLNSQVVDDQHVSSIAIDSENLEQMIQKGVSSASSPNIAHLLRKRHYEILNTDVDVIGLFGDLSAIYEFLFSHVDMCDEAKEVLSGNRVPGLFAVYSATSKMVYLLLRPEGTATDFATGSSVNCNLVRYLTELSVQLVYFAEPKELQAIQEGYSKKTEKNKARSKRFIMKHKLGNKDDVELGELQETSLVANVVFHQNASYGTSGSIHGPSSSRYLQTQTAVKNVIFLDKNIICVDKSFKDTEIKDERKTTVFHGSEEFEEWFLKAGETHKIVWPDDHTFNLIFGTGREHSRCFEVFQTVKDKYLSDIEQLEKQHDLVSEQQKANCNRTKRVMRETAKDFLKQIIQEKGENVSFIMVFFENEQDNLCSEQDILLQKEGIQEWNKFTRKNDACLLLAEKLAWELNDLILAAETGIARAMLLWQKNYANCKELFPSQEEHKYIYQKMNEHFHYPEAAKQNWGREKRELANANSYFLSRIFFKSEESVTKYESELENIRACLKLERGEVVDEALELFANQYAGKIEEVSQKLFLKVSSLIQAQQTTESQKLQRHLKSLQQESYENAKMSCDRILMDRIVQPSAVPLLNIRIQSVQVSTRAHYSYEYSYRNTRAVPDHRNAMKFRVQYIEQVQLPGKSTSSFFSVNPEKHSYVGHQPQLKVTSLKSQIPWRAISLEEGYKREGLYYLTGGEKVLIFFQCPKNGHVEVYLGDCSKLRTAKPFKSLKKRIQLLAFEEGTRLAAFYMNESRMLEVYRFDAEWRRWSRVSHANLDLYPALLSDGGPRQLLLVPNSQMLCILDSHDQCHFFEIQTKQIQPRSLSLEEPFLKALVTPDGSCLLTAVQDVEGHDGITTPGSCSEAFLNDDSAEAQTDKNVRVNVFLLQKKKKLKSIVLPDVFKVSNCDRMRVMKVAGDTVLVTNDHQRFWTQKLKIHTETSVFDCTAFDSEHNSEQAGIDQQLNQKVFLDYLYHAFDKYPVSDPISSSPKLLSILGILPATEDEYNQKLTGGTFFRNYLKQLVLELEHATRKECMDLIDSVKTTWSNDACRAMMEMKDSSGNHSIQFVDWIEKMMCLVPIQIARAENNSLMIQSNNFFPVEGGNVFEISESIDFGFYERIIAKWSGPVKVISSMGKQSTGKSYMLNHLSGSHFDIAGTRCTEGVWMTVRKEEDCLYVVLDFEGLGSIERSDQEDMLMSVFNAAISGLTLYKTEFRIDSDTINMWAKFRDGVNLIKGDDRLLRGWFYIIIKDVDLRDVDDLEREFMEKLTKICQKDENNFLNRMYNGQLCISTFPFLGRPQFYHELANIKDHIQSDKCPAFESGTEFLDVIKLLLAKIQIQDWQSFDRTALMLATNKVRHYLDYAVKIGRLSEDEDDVLLDQNGDEITGFALELAPNDSGLELSGNEGGVHAKASLLAMFKADDNGSLVQPKSSEEWFNECQSFLWKLCERRRQRVLAWLEASLSHFKEDADVGALRREVTGLLDKQKNEYTMCGSVCERCFRRCLQQRYHKDECDCMTSHKCSAACEFCSQNTTKMGKHMHSEDQEATGRAAAATQGCSEPAGHEGRHNCGLQDHTCGRRCALSDRSQCGKYCAKEPGHEESGDTEHMCSARHLCGAPCALPSCGQSCCIPVDVDHGQPGQTPHSCITLACPEDCLMPGCNSKCHCTGTHFHALQLGPEHLPKEMYDPENHKDPINLACLSIAELEQFCIVTSISVDSLQDETARGDDDESANIEKRRHKLLLMIESSLKSNGKIKHFCGQSHQCPKICEEPGICDIQSECIVEEKEYTTAFNQVIKYEKKTEQNGRRRQCCMPIPAFQEEHEGKHVHTLEANHLHFCDVRCPSCGYFCTQAYGHNGLHSTDHGNMRLAKFVSEGEDFAVGDRRYGVGDVGEAEMCNMYCRSLGRGHLHVAYCSSTAHECTASREDGVQHAVVKYNPDPDKEKDEMNHSAFWTSIRFADPCAPDEIDSFKKCPAECPFPEHQEDSGSKSYCLGELWHEPFTQANLPEDLAAFSGGRIMGDGHFFECRHQTNIPVHTVFVLDRSGSMNASQWKPQRSNFPQNHLGCVLEACHCYLAQRCGSGGGSQDRMSIIAFETNPAVLCNYEQLDLDTFASKTANIHPAGGTNFTAALQAAFDVISSAEAQALGSHCQELKPMIIFLSDGFGNHADVALRNLLQARQRTGKQGGVRLHTISFGSHQNQQLELLAQVSRDFETNDEFAYQSSFESSISGIELAETFITLATSLQPKRGGLIV